MPAAIPALEQAFPGETRRTAGLEVAAPGALAGSHPGAAAWTFPPPAAIPGLLSPPGTRLCLELVPFSSGPSHLPRAILSVISDFDISLIPKKLEVPNGDETTPFTLSISVFTKRVDSNSLQGIFVASSSKLCSSVSVQGSTRIFQQS